MDKRFKYKLERVTPEVSRRDFIRTGALLGGGLLIAFRVPAAGRFGAAGGKGFAGAAGVAGETAPNAYLRIAPDNTITVVLAHAEMGQGIWTTLPMLIADELDAAWKDIKVEHAPAGKDYAHTVFGIQITGGSSTTWSEFDRYRMAGATARVALVQAAAKRWGVAAENCKTAEGYVVAGDKKASYGDLAQDAAALPPPQKLALRPASEWKYIGKGAKRLDAPAKTNGTAKFGMDMQFPGLLTAVVAHAPAFGGKVKSFDATKAKAVPGVKQVVQIPTGVAVIAEHFWAATQGRKALEIIWDAPPAVTLDTAEQVVEYRKLAATKGLPAAQKGDAEKALSGATTLVEAEYIFPYLAHAPMEPLNCTVKLAADHCDIWVGTQLPGLDQAAAAKILGFAPDQVTVNTVFLGGGFGRRATTQSDFVSEAVQIAKASGQFIKMVWTREDDMKSGYYRPAFVHRVKVGLDGSGMPVAWKHNIAGQSIMAGTPFAAMIKNGIDDSSVEGISDSPYLDAVPDHYIGLHTTTSPIPVLWFRSVGNTHTAYVMETMVDELAHAAGQDPVAYRRMLLKGQTRHLAALNLAAEKAGWDQPLPAGRFRGVAVHESFQSYVAQVVEISMEEGLPKVHKVTCAIDLGVAVNPDGVRAQMESGIIFALTMALYGEISIEKGMVKQSNFYDYRIARMYEAPAIEVHIVPSTEKMGGAGEPGVPPMAPALANAVFAATGKRVYKLPMVLSVLVVAIGLLALSFTQRVGPVSRKTPAADSVASVQAFMGVYKVLMSPRCMNCHPAGDAPLQGDDSHVHTMNVQRGIDGHGVYALKCSNCHQPQNVPGPHTPPGNPKWALPPATMKMVFQGRTPRQLARQLLDPKQNGGKTKQQLIEHATSDGIVLGGWNPGEGRTLPPMSHAEFARLFRTWIVKGAYLPAK
jgi:isoquinoline 1-oxidoreductase subunit beta